MRIAFVGKGGAGKTTLSALFTRHLVALGLPVLAIDADINQHLGQALGLSDSEVAAIPPLGADQRWIKEYLRGNNPRISSAKAMIKTTPPGRGSRLLQLCRNDEFHQRFARPAAGADLIVTGDFESEDIGVSCYHAKTGAVELYLNHLIDGPDEYVVVDMTAGADAFASGIFTRFDLVVLVCEPTKRGVGVYRQFQQHANKHDVLVRVVGNKVATEQDREWLQAELGHALLATIGQSAWVRAMEQGSELAFDRLEPDVRAALHTVLNELNGLKKDWNTYHRNTVYFHLLNAKAWGDEATGLSLADQVDPEFVPGRRMT